MSYSVDESLEEDRLASQTSVLKSSALVLAAQLFSLGSSLCLNFLLAYSLGPAGRGLIYSVQIISALGLTLLNCGIAAAAVYYCRDAKFERRTIADWVLSYSLLLGVLPVGVFLVCWRWAAPLISYKMEPKYFLVALLGIPCMVLTWNVAYLCLGMNRIHMFNVFRVGASFLFLIMLVLTTSLHRHDPWRVTLLWLFSLILPSAFAVGIALQAGARWRLNVRGFFDNHFKYAWHSHLAAVTQYLQYRADVLMVGFFLAIKDLGQYGLAVTIGELIWNVPTAVAVVLMPHIAERSKADADKISPVFCRLTLALTAILGLLVVVAAGWFVPRFLPAFQPSIPILWLLMPGIVLASIFKILSSDLSGRGRPLEPFYPAFISLLVTIGAGVLVIPRFGLRAAAIVSSIGYLINACLYLYSFSKITHIPVNHLLILRMDDLKLLQRRKLASRRPRTLDSVV